MDNKEEYYIVANSGPVHTIHHVMLKDILDHALMGLRWKRGRNGHDLPYDAARAEIWEEMRNKLSSKE